MTKKQKRLDKSTQFVLPFSQIMKDDIAIVGGKNASLGEMFQIVSRKGINIPDGFAVTATAYQEFLDYNNLQQPIFEALGKLKHKNVKNLAVVGRSIRDLIKSGVFPKKVEKEIYTAYRILSKKYKMKDADVAVRSSATAEDLPEASFAGQQESYLNITGKYDLLQAVKKCFASLFTNRAISYRVDKGFSHEQVKISVGVQKMVRSDEAVSGVMFSIDTESGFEDMVLINSSYGLGENIVKGVVNPDEFFVYKKTLIEGFDKGRFKYKPIVKKNIGTKRQKLIYSVEGSSPTKNVPVPAADRNKFTLGANEILKLAYWATIIEKHYKKAQDIEWAKDGKTGKLFIVQARPETVHFNNKDHYLTSYKLKQTGRAITTGHSVGEKIGQGTARVIKDVKRIAEFKPGDVLVTDITDPDWEPIMKIASAIVTNRGGRTSHAAIVSRELGIPCVVGTNNATQKIKNGQKITVSCAEGETGNIYKGLIPFTKRRVNLKTISKPRVKIMMNIGDPETAFSNSFIPNSGVGLARIELIIINHIKIHPLALINFRKLKDPVVKDFITKQTMGYSSKRQFYRQKLAEGIGQIAAAFYPKEVIVRLVDFKSNEYAGLIGGVDYEPKEENPMLGWRGASRYYHPSYKEAFKLECQALQDVRDKFGLSNVKVMIPFCRTPEEGKKVIKLMSENGLKRSSGMFALPRSKKKKQNDLEIYVMAELPSNIILAKEFAENFDGFSIGSNDLTQLVLGVDRDSDIVADIFDERNEAVKTVIKQLLREARKYHRKVGICGQAPSDFPEFAKFLATQRIDSISLNPDTVLKTTRLLARRKRTNKKA